MNTENKNIHIIIETTFGDIEAKLYDETPLHRDNTIKLIENGFYDNQIFHRIIKDFMIQGGDPLSTTSSREENSDSVLNYFIPAEIVYPQHYHKRGAFAAARLGDNINPQKESSPTQFYIVTGSKFTDAELDLMEKRRFEKLKQSIFAEINEANKEKIKEFYRNGKKDKLSELRDSFVTQADSLAIQNKSDILFTEEQRNTYKTIGGAPHLDGDYTVYGEIVNGMDIIDKIQQVATNGGDKPLKDIKMRVTFKNKD